MKQQISNNIFLNSDNSGDSLDVYVMEQIGADWWTGGGVTKQAILNEIKGKKVTAINLYISSPGGDVDEALAIKDLLIGTKAPITAEVSGLTASAATIIMLAAGKIKMSEDSMILIHNASTWSGGNKEDLRKTADTLEMIDNLIAKMYAKKSGKDEQLIKDQMLKDSFMTADEAIALGIVDEKVSKIPVTAKVKAAIKNAVEKKYFTLPANYNLEENQTTDMAEKKTIREQVIGFLNDLKKEGFKIVGVEDKDEKEQSKKLTDLTDGLIKNLETVTPVAEETTITGASDYSATTTESVNSIELADGKALQLDNAPYDVTADGASSLQTDLTSALNGTAQAVTVTFDEAATALSISVTGSDVELATINGSVKFTKAGGSEEEKPEEETPANLKKKLESVKNQIEAEKKKKPVESEEVKNLKEELRIKNEELAAIKTGKSGGKANGKTPKIKSESEEQEEELAPGEAGMLNMFAEHVSRKSKG